MPQTIRKLRAKWMAKIIQMPYLNSFIFVSSMATGTVKAPGIKGIKQSR